MKYTTNSKLAQCPLADVATDTTDGAASDPVCSDALIGSGHAFARIPGFPTPNNEAELTVLAFNGETSTAGGGFTGGFPTIILHADNAALPTTPVLGEIRPSSSGADYGSQLNVPDAPDVAGDAGALVQFGSQVARKWNNGKTGNKKKKYNLITVELRVAGDGDLDFQGTWTTTTPPPTRTRTRRTARLLVAPAPVASSRRAALGAALLFALMPSLRDRGARDRRCQ